MITINLRVVMAKRRMNIQDVHEKTKLSRTTISNLYNENVTGVTLSTLDKLCTALECEVEEILQYHKQGGN